MAAKKKTQATAKAAKAPKAAKKQAEAKPKKLSALDAAAKVLKETGQAMTTKDVPFVTVDVDLAAPFRARLTYPRYVFRDDGRPAQGRKMTAVV